MTDTPTNRWSVFGVASATMLMTSVDQTIVATALGAIRSSFETSIAWVTWTITAYALGRVMTLPIAGHVGDLYGRRRVFVFSIGLFTVASLLCGLANSIWLLVTLRWIQAIGGGAFIPSATAAVAHAFGRDRDRAVGMFMSILPIGGMVGPALGGYFVEYWSWRGIFIVNIPLGVALGFLAWRVFPRDPPPPPDRHLDLRGCILLGVAVLSAMFAITLFGVLSGVPALLGATLGSVFACLATLVFVRHIRRHPSPVLPARLVLGSGFAATNAINVVYGAAALGFSTLVPLYAVNRYAIPIINSGSLLSARSVAVVVVSAVAALAIRRTGYRWPMAIGFLVSALGLATMALHPIGMSAFRWLAIGAAISGVGTGVSTPASNNAALHLAPEMVSSAAGVRAMFRQIGSIAAVSGTSAVLARSNDPGYTQGHLFLGFAGLLVLTIPLVLRIPAQRGEW